MLQQGTRRSADQHEDDQQPSRSGESLPGDKSKDRVKPITKACTECARRKTKCSGGLPCVQCEKTVSACEYLASQRRGPKIRKGSHAVDIGDSGRERGFAVLHIPARRTPDDIPVGDINLAGLRQASVPVSGHRLADAHCETQDVFHQSMPGQSTLTGSLPDFSHLLHFANEPQLDNPPLLQAVGDIDTLYGFAGDALVTNLGPTTKESDVRTGFPATSDPSPASESTFAQSVYRAEGPGINHFTSILSRQFSQQEQDAHTTLWEPSYSDSTFSPVSSDAVLPPDIERDLQSLADMPATQSALLGLYFCFVHPQWPILYRPAFDACQAANETPMLYNAMLALICRYDVSRQLQHVPSNLKSIPLTSRLGELFTRRATASLDIVNMTSSIQTVQALFMLALREVAQGYTSKGWMYAGISVRMAFDLQLHQPAKLSEDSSPIKAIIAQERLRTIWCCYTLDKTISLFLGRPCMMRYNDIEAPLPSHLETDEFSYWTEDARAIIPDSISKFVGVQARCVTTLIAWIKLLRIIEKTMDTVYSSGQSGSKLSRADFWDLNGALDTWWATSPEVCKRAENLAASTTNLTTLMMWYHACRIIINRPFIPSNSMYLSPGGQKSAYTLCLESADAIVETVVTLEGTHGIFRCSHSIVFLIFQAGVLLTLVHATAKDLAQAAKASQSLRLCIGWLDQMTGTYRCGAQYRGVLHSMEQLSKRELRNDLQVTQIMASRRGSRASSPALVAPALALDNDGHGELPTANLAGMPASTENPLGNLHYSFFNEMPLSLPMENGDLASWLSWERDYGSLLLESVSAEGDLNAA